jgi:hypothetical protein
MIIGTQMKRTPPIIAGHITEGEQAARSGVTIATLRRWRVRGYGPKPVRFGRFILYAQDANEQFIAEQVTAAENSHKPRGRGRPRSA